MGGLGFDLIWKACGAHNIRLTSSAEEEEKLGGLDEEVEDEVTCQDEFAVCVLNHWIFTRPLFFVSRFATGILNSCLFYTFSPTPPIYLIAFALFSYNLKPNPPLKKNTILPQDAGFRIHLTTPNLYIETTVKTDLGHHPWARIFIWSELISERSGWGQVQFIKGLKERTLQTHAVHPLISTGYSSVTHVVRFVWGQLCVWLCSWLCCLIRSVEVQCLCSRHQTDLLGLSLWNRPVAVWIGCGSAGGVFHQWSGRCGCVLRWLWRTPPWKAASPAHRHVLRDPPPWSWCSALFQKTQNLSTAQWPSWFAQVAVITLNSQLCLFCQPVEETY